MVKAIEVSGLRMSYGSHEVVKGLDLIVDEGEIVAVLGPNGSGKTTTVEILEGLRNRTGGEVAVLGQDPATAPERWRHDIGVVPQDSQLLPELTAAETVAMQAGWYDNPLPVADALALVGLTEHADQRARKMSGGQQRRLDLALAVVGNPRLVFLDEPTTGFDPSARREAWDVVAGLRSAGRTVLLTTHYMEEAEVLADRIVMVADGRVVAEGSAEELSGRLQAKTMLRWRPDDADPAPPDALAARPTGDGTLAIETDDVVGDLNALTGWALASGIDLVGLSVVRPDLDDVFLHLARSSGDSLAVSTGEGA